MKMIKERSIPSKRWRLEQFNVTESKLDTVNTENIFSLTSSKFNDCDQNKEQTLSGTLVKACI